MFPAYVNCTTIDWFSEWPKEALLEVAMKYLEEVQLTAETNPSQDSTELHKNVATVFVTMHRSVVEMSERMLFEMKRHNYVTPTNYLELVSGYKLYVSFKSLFKEGEGKREEERERERKINYQV